jgi:hypothetical protein
MADPELGYTGVSPAVTVEYDKGYYGILLMGRHSQSATIVCLNSTN